ncbi:MAG: hypothetical protein V4515_09910 [Chloroflexota bacterium]
MIRRLRSSRAGFGAGLDAGLGACVVAGAILLAACGQTPGATSSGSPDGTPSSSRQPGGSAGTGYTVTAAQDASLGSFLAGEGGRTLYVLITDTPGVSTCTGACASNWPPFVLEAGETVAGSTGVPGTFGAITRADGTTQVTYADAPLYYFAGDAAPGDVNGQGINDVWFVAAPGGGPNRGPDASPAATRNSNY